MARQQTRISRRMLITWCVLASFIVLLLPDSITSKCQLVFARIFRWPLTMSTRLSRLSPADSLPADVISRIEYNRLQNHVTYLTEKLAAERKKVEQLSGLRGKFGREMVKFRLADVITFADGTQTELIINRGSEDGIAKEQFVLGDNSIIGTISDVSAMTAKVRLITDIASKIAVQIPPLKIDRVMQGTGDSTAKIRLIPAKYDVKVGDAVLAGKKTGFLATPFITGKVVRCKRETENPSLLDITVEPVCDFQQLSNVAVLIMESK